MSKNGYKKPRGPFPMERPAGLFLSLCPVIRTGFRYGAAGILRFYHFILANLIGCLQLCPRLIQLIQTILYGGPLHRKGYHGLEQVAVCLLYTSDAADEL